MAKQFYEYSTFTHIFLGVFFISLSVINKDIRGIIWLSGALISTTISHFASKILIPTEEQICWDGDVRPEYSMREKTSPALSSNIISYTISYLLFPMLSVKKINTVVIVALVLFFVLDGYTKVRGPSKLEQCATKAMDVIIIGLIGLLFGYLWYKFLEQTGNERMFYFNEFLGNNAVCKKPSKSQYKCRVYKNGELITNI